MVEFAGYNMPVEYSGIRNEHLTVREKIGVFDVSHMGEFWVKGDNATDFVQKITSNNVNNLSNGKIQYSCFINNRGGIIDDLLVYRIDEKTYMLVVNASNIQKDWSWCIENAKSMNIEIGKELYNASEEICQLAIQGPLSLKVMQKLTDESVEDMEYYTFKKCTLAGIENVIFSTTGYTGSKGCEIYVANEDGAKLWEAIFEVGEEFGIKPIGLGARDTLRIEAGYCLYGNDINEETSPIEAGLGWITKLVDDNDFIGRHSIEKQKASGESKKLKGFVLNEKGIPRKDYKIFNEKKEEIGTVTSGTISPLLNKGIGLAYLDKGYWKEGTIIYIKIRNKSIKATVTKPPFYNA